MRRAGGGMGRSTSTYVSTTYVVPAYAGKRDGEGSWAESHCESVFGVVVRMRYVCKRAASMSSWLAGWLATWLVCGIHDGGAVGSVCVSHEDSCVGATVRLWPFLTSAGRGGEREVVSRYLGAGRYTDDVGDAM
jgi:hypothetical protein